MKKPEELYFIAIIPPEPINEEAMKYKLDFQNKYNSKASLKSPPHITLHMPFKMGEKKMRELNHELGSFSQLFETFSIELMNFNHFGERVIYVDVAHSDTLDELQKALTKFMKVNFNIFNATHKDNGFHPHMTIAFRDLKREFFKIAWDEYKNKKYERNFEVNRLTLLKHNGAKWEVFENYYFKNSTL